MGVTPAWESPNLGFTLSAGESQRKKTFQLFLNEERVKEKIKERVKEKVKERVNHFYKVCLGYI